MSRFMLIVNFLIMDYQYSNLYTFLKGFSVSDSVYKWKLPSSCTVPNAATPPSKVFEMYKRGTPIPPLPESPNQTSLVHGYFPKDPSEVRQLASDALRAEYDNFQAAQAAQTAQSAASSDVVSA